MDAKLKELEEKLGTDFKNKDLLLQALCHRSYLNENPDFGLGQNERLEFLGDSVLQLVITDYLYITYPRETEGVLTNWRASLVNSKELGEVAESLGVYDYILLSKGESRDQGKSRLYILADTFEAIIGAIYLDLGYVSAKKIIEENLTPRLPRIIELGLYRDSKSILQEKAQEKLSITPVYKTINEIGPDHKKQFVMGVFVEDDLLGKGRGDSKKEAEEEAAKIALRKKGWLKNQK